MRRAARTLLLSSEFSVRALARIYGMDGVYAKARFLRRMLFCL